MEKTLLERKRLPTFSGSLSKSRSTMWFITELASMKIRLMYYYKVIWQSPGGRSRRAQNGGLESFSPARSSSSERHSQVGAGLELFMERILSASSGRWTSSASTVVVVDIRREELSGYNFTRNESKSNPTQSISSDGNEIKSNPTQSILLCSDGSAQTMWTWRAAPSAAPAVELVTWQEIARTLGAVKDIIVGHWSSVIWPGIAKILGWLARHSQHWK